MTTTSLDTQLPGRATPAPEHRGLVARWSRLPVPRAVDRGAPLSAVARMLVGTLVGIVGLAALVAKVLGLEDVAAPLFAAYLSVGVGAAICLWFRRLTAAEFGFFAITAGVAFPVAVGFVLAEFRWWSLVGPTAVIAGIATAGTVVIHLVGDGRSLESGQIGAAVQGLIAPIDRCVVAAGALFGLALCVVEAVASGTPPMESGLLGTVGPMWFLGYGLIAASFCVAVLRRSSPAIPVVAAGTVVILTQAIVYGAPTVMAAARHIGLTRFIVDNGGVTAADDIYQAWPGLFAGTAWVSAASGYPDLLSYATVWPVVVSAALVLGVRVLAGRVLPTDRAWIAAGVFAVAGAVNSMYFAPQVAGLLLAIAVLSLVLNPPQAQTPRERVGRISAVVVLSLVIVVTHQITPYMLGFALIALVLFRLVAPWWLPLLVLVPAVAWAVFNYQALSRYIDLSAIGSLFGNIAPPDHPDPVAGMPEVTRMAFLVPAAALVVLGVIALIGVARSRDRWAFGLAAAMVSPLGLALGTNYGQEGVFRVVLFATPWLAILVARTSTFSSLAARVALSVGFAVMMAVNVYGQTALDWARIVRTDDVRAVESFERSAPDGSLLLSVGTKNATPTRITERYGDVGYTSRDRVGGFPDAIGPAYDPDLDVKAFTQAFSRQSATVHYALVSDSIGAYDDRYGLQRFDDYERLKAAMASSPLWTELLSTSNATLYRLTTEPSH